MGVNNFKLALDTLGPSACGILSPATAQNIQSTIIVTYNLPTGTSDSDHRTGNAAFIKSWASQTQNDNTPPANIGWKAVDTVASGETFNLSPNGTSDGRYWIHAIFMDIVGNVSEVKHSPEIRADNVAPTVTLCTIKDPDSGSESYVNNGTVKFSITCSDSASNINRVVVSGPFSGTNPKEFPRDSLTPNQDGSYSITDYVFTLLDNSPDVLNDGTKTFIITVYDNSGNSTKITKTIILDRQITNPTLVLRNTADTANFPDYVNGSSNNPNAFIALIGVGSQTDIIKYKFWGDFEQKTGSSNNNWSAAQTTEPSSWSNWTAGSTSKTVGSAALPLRLTSGDGTKYFYVKILDSAGNESVLTSPGYITRVYDTAAPVLTIKANGAASTWIADGLGSYFQGTNSQKNAVITYTAVSTPANFASGSPSFSYRKDGVGDWVTISGVSGGTFDFNATAITAAHSNQNTDAHGVYEIKISATDLAGNSSSATCIVNVEHSFSLGSVTMSGGVISGFEDYYNATSQSNMKATVTMDPGPASGRSATKLYLFTNNSSSDVTVPNDTLPVSWDVSGATLSDIATINKDLHEGGGNYLHVKAISAVGNVAYLCTEFNYDTENPDFTLTLTSPSVTNSPTISFALSSGTDGAVSGFNNLYQMQISSAPTHTGGWSGWQTYADGSYSITITDGVSAKNRSISIQARDKAGNVITKTVTFELDLVAPVGTCQLLTNSGNAQTSLVTSEQAFRLTINWNSDNTDTIAGNDISYQVYGDVTGGASAGDPTSTTGLGNNYDVSGTWTTMNSASITTAANWYYLTKNSSQQSQDNVEGVIKTIYVALKDNAGNITVLTPLQIRLNQNAATLEVVYTSHDRISCVGNIRLTGSGTNISESSASSFGTSVTIDGNSVSSYTTTFANNTAASDRADIMVFTVKSNQDVIEWKVCAYTASTYPATGTSGQDETAIVKYNNAAHTSLSNGYTDTINDPSNAIKVWNVIVDGYDYQQALRARANISAQNEVTGDVDGTHWIAVYAKNKAGIWSKAVARV